MRKRKINCRRPKGFSEKAHCALKKGEVLRARGEPLRLSSMYEEKILVYLLESIEKEDIMPKDACYHKVKARYRVFPSAYASGAIAKCRKVGAANYGTGGKKKAKKKAEGGVIELKNGGSVPKNS